MDEDVKVWNNGGSNLGIYIKKQILYIYIFKYIFTYEYHHILHRTQPLLMHKEISLVEDGVMSIL